MTTPSTLVRTLSVLPNRWLHIDSWGQPVGQVLVEPTPDVAPRYVGSRIARAEMIRPEKKTRTGIRYAQHRHFVDYKAEPVSVPNTGYYRDRVRARELFPADEQTARLCGVKFADPAKLEESTRAEAIAHFDAANGDGAFAALQAEFAPKAEAAPEPDAPKKANRPTKD